MINDNFSKKLEEMEKPRASLPEQERRLRLAFLNAKKSAWWGAVLIFLPTLFVFIQVLKNEIGFGGLYDPFAPLFSVVDKVNIFGLPISPIIFLGGLFLALIINILAVVHISGEKLTHSLVLHFELKKKGWNIAVIILAGSVLAILLGYALLENWQCIIGLQERC